MKIGDKMTSVSGLDLVWMLIRRYMEIVKEEFGEKLLAMAVFGSLARGEAKFPGSDIDVLIVLKGVENLSFGKRINLMREAERKLSKTEEYKKFEEVFGWSPSIQEHVLTPEELRRHPPLLLDMTTDAVILHDEGILSEELEKLKRRLKELGAKKIRTGDTWFWILKPDLKLGEELEL